MSNKKNYYLVGALAFLIWGFVPIPFKALSNYQAGQILYFRILFATLTLALFFLLFKRKVIRETLDLLKSFSNRQRTKFIFLTVAGGLLLATNWIFFVYVIQHISVKAGTFSYFICPVITAVLGYFILKEKLSFLQWIAVGICVISCVLVGKDSISEMGYSLLIGFTYAFYIVSQRKNVLFDRLLILLIQLFTTAILLTPFYSQLVGEAPSQSYFYSMIIFIAILFTVIPLFLNLYALRGLSSGVIGFLMYMNPLVSFSLALFYFNETISILQIIAYSIVIIAIVLFNYQSWVKMSKRER